MKDESISSNIVVPLHNRIYLDAFKARHVVDLVLKDSLIGPTVVDGIHLGYTVSGQVALLPSSRKNHYAKR